MTDTDGLEHELLRLRRELDLLDEGVVELLAQRGQHWYIPNLYKHSGILEENDVVTDARLNTVYLPILEILCGRDESAITAEGDYEPVLQIDKVLQDLVYARIGYGIQIAKVKHQMGTGVQKVGREEEVIAHVRKVADQNGINADKVESIYNDVIINYTRILQCFVIADLERL